MARRHSNPLATVNAPRWIKSFDRFNNELTSRCIEPLADLQAEMAAECARWAADGWEVDGDGKWGSLFVSKGGERRCVVITPAEHSMESHTTASFGPRRP